MPLRTRVITGLILLLLILSATRDARADAWRGRIETRDGVPHVLNPAEPTAPHRVVALRELWRLGGESEADEEFFGMVEQIRLDAEGNVHILDVQLNEIRVFSPEGAYLRTIGQEGEGPGDFRNATNFFVLSDGRVGVIQIMPMRITMMTAAGGGLDDMPVPDGNGGSLYGLLGDARTAPGLLLLHRTAATLTETGQESVEALIACDPQGGVIGTWRENRTTIDHGGTVRVNPDPEVEYAGHWSLFPDGRCCVAPSYTGYRIEMIDPAGATRQVIERDYEPLPREREEIREIEDRFRALKIGGKELRLDINPLRRDIVSLEARPNGELWVLTSRGEAARAENTVGRFDVFDAEGRFRRTLALAVPHDPDYDEVMIRRDRLFLLKEVNNGPRELHSSSAAGDMVWRMGEEGKDDDAREPQPFEIVCYELPESTLR